jgi:hypothetical protein
LGAWAKECAGDCRGGEVRSGADSVAGMSEAFCLRNLSGLNKGVRVRSLGAIST